MPTYEYKCLKCGYHFDVFQSIRDKTRKVCPKCKGRVKKLISGGAGLIFKGSGFYITDYKKASAKKSGNKNKEQKKKKKKEEE